MKRPIRLVVNPAAGGGGARRDVARAARRLREIGADFDVVRTLAPGHATELARAFIAAEPDGVLAVVGGDGTVHEAVQAFGESPGRGVLAFVPAGGGNDARRTIGSPKTVEAAVETAAGGAEMRLDLGVFGGEFFFNGVGVGLDGETAARSKDFRFLGGLPAYLAAAIATIASYDNPTFQVECGSETWEGRGILCAVGNGPSCGGGFLLTPDASASDGALDACVLGDFGRLEALANLPKALFGAHRGHRKARFLRGGEVTLSADRPLFAHADGEIRRPEFPLRFSVVPAAVRAAIPPVPDARGG